MWLARFRYGPLEWVWRCATWWSIVPLRRAAVGQYRLRSGRWPVPKMKIDWLPRRPEFRRRTTCTQSDRRVRHFEEVRLAA
ncbi:DUF418 domain-containing protein [Saccharopolyspora pogona]|uniref:DUF418 domain-containing protein n=1 Tax=Saccharopolyspora pogona TaxID=333966 RepID=UPI0021E0E6F3|nr:DUF418 domain-containing protein [Saccharopolyspora pogona]